MIPPSPLDLSSGEAVMGNDVATETEENETQVLRERKKTSKWLISKKNDTKTYLTS